MMGEGKGSSRCEVAREVYADVGIDINADGDDDDGDSQPVSD